METACLSFGLVYWKWIIKFVSFISKGNQLDVDDSGCRRHDGDNFFLSERKISWIWMLVEVGGGMMEIRMCHTHWQGIPFFGTAFSQVLFYHGLFPKQTGVEIEESCRSAILMMFSFFTWVDTKNSLPLL